ncbi:MAG: hypothetical protein IKQ87_02960 [Clostridia bacterium]|nr:hypothetical protein [Clostridia bacterium]
MRTIEIDIRSRAEAEEYILACEKRFNDTIDEALEGIFTHGDIKTIALAGPTCSGKTTTAEKITRRIRKAGKQAVVLSIDDFFLSRADRNVVDGEAPDYDSAAAIDLETLETFMDRLNRGLPVLVPRFDFSSAARVGYHEYIPREEDIYLFEGIQAVYPEVTRLFGPGYKSIFINVNEDCRYGNVVLEKEEIRLLRRTVRDRLFRGATPEFTLHLWETVRANEEKNIFPNAAGCDLHLESFLEYEPFLLANYGVGMLDSVPKDSRYRPAADEVLVELREFDCPYFEESMIPKNSLFREFIGGKE